MNFQTISTAQKLPQSDGLAGGYLDGQPGPLLASALDFIDAQVGRIAAAAARDGRLSDTALILSAKHGQSPIDLGALVRLDDGPLIEAVDTAWTAQTGSTAPLVAQATDDDVLQWWLSDRSPAALTLVRRVVEGYTGTGNNAAGAPVPLAHAGVTTLYTGAGAARYFETTTADSRVPDVFGIVRHGLVYTGGQSKIAEHGGAATDDRNVALLVAAPGGPRDITVTRPVKTTRIAPTILALLGQPVTALDAVRIEHTPTLAQN